MSVVASMLADKADGREPLSNRGSHDDIVQLADGVTMSACGVDTVSFAWRSDDPGLRAKLRAPLRDGCLLEGVDPLTGEILASSPVDCAKSGGPLLRWPVAGCRVGYYLDWCPAMIWIEGRLAPMLTGDPKAPGLASPSQLEVAADIAAREISRYLAPFSLAGGDCVVRRLDPAVDLSFTCGDEGLRMLRALSAIDLPRLKSDAWRKDGRTETILFKTPKRAKTRLRIYDRGVASGTQPPGCWVRIEQECRFVKRAQRAPGVLVGEDLGALWAKQLSGWEASENVVVAGLDAAEKALLKAVSDGTMNPYTAERLIGTLRMRASGITKSWWGKHGKSHIWSRRSAELRQAGIILDEDGLGGPERKDELPLGAILKQLRQAWPQAAAEDPQETASAAAS